MTLIEGEIEEIIASSVDKCLDDVGKGFRELFYWSLETRVGVKRDEIAEKPEEFVKYLDKMFASGSDLIKDEIISQISSDLRIPKTSSKLDLLIKYARETG